MEVVGPRKPTLALPLPLPRPSIVDRQRTGGLFASLFASIVKCVGQQKPAPRTLVLAWMQARWSCILSIPGAHCSRTLGYLSWLVGRGCNSSGQGSGRGGQARNQRWGTRRRGTRRVWWEVGSAVGMEHHTSAASGISGGAPSGLQQRPRQTSPRARSRRHYRRRRGPRCKLLRCRQHCRKH